MNGKKFKKKIASLTAVCLVCALVVSGCGKENNNTAGGGKITYPEDGSIYPMQTNDVLSVFTNYDVESPKMEKWEKATGVDIEWMSTATGGAEALSLMIASNELPDIILTNFFNQAGGIQKYANDKIIMDITEPIKKYAPNFRAWLDKDDTVRKMSVSDDGKNYFFPCIRYEDVLRSYRGPIVRKDLLTKYGLEVPETIDDWHNVLTTFKKNGLTAPLSYDINTYESIGGILGAYGVVTGFYMDNGEVKYGYLEDGMREGLKTLAQWYKEGLMGENLTYSSSNQDKNILNSKTGITFATSGGGMGKYLKTAKDNGDSSFDLEGIALPVLNKGDKPKFSESVFPVTYDNNGFITTQCDNVELATRFLDYGYSEKGHMQMNFGEEGLSYEMKDGKPVYTDLIMNNPDGKSVGEAMTEYIFGNWSGPFAQDVNYIEQYNAMPQQKAALKFWGEQMDMTHTMPQITLTQEESSKVTAIVNNVKTCADENLFKFIMGIKSVDTDYDAFVKELEGFGIREVIDIYNTAVKRYNAR